MRTDALVQPKAIERRETNTAEAVAVAERGVAGASDTYPHRETIQQSFGKHSLDGLFSSSGPEAARASDQLGARAYAYGDRVAFGETPDLHTASHEAAHFVQQRAGIACAGGTSGDRFEHHADAVADAVVAGRSAEPILDQLAGAGRDAAPASPVIQRKDIEDYYRGPQTAYTYAGVHYRKILDALNTRLASAALPDPHPRLLWAITPKSIADVFEQALDVATRGLEFLNARLPDLLYPIDPWAIIDRNRQLVDGRPGEKRDGYEATGVIDWNPSVGDAIAIELEGRIRDSVPRMGLRYVAQADNFHGELPAQQLVTTMPIDRAVAQLLCAKGVVKHLPDKQKGSKKPRDVDAPTAFKNGLQLVTFEWVEDPDLWNWIRFEPANATREEVSAALYDRGDGENHTEYAYALQLSGNMCQVPVDWARKFPVAAKREPRDATAPDGALALADTRMGDDVAVMEGARHRDATKKEPRPDFAKLGRTLEESQRQLELLRDTIAPWGVAHMIGPAWRWVTKHRENLLAAPDETIYKWRPIIEGQKKLLFDATTDIDELIAGAKGKDPASPEAKPFADVVRAFAIALGESHLIDTAATQLANAKRLKAGLPILLLEMSVHDHREATEDYVAQGPKAKPWEHGDPAQTARDEDNNLSRQALALRAKMISGGAVESDEVETVAVAAAELAFRKRVKSLGMRLWDLEQLALDTTSSATAKLANIFNTNIHGLPGELIEIFNEVFALTGRLDDQIAKGLAKDAPKEPKAYERFSIRVRRQAVADGEAALKVIAEKHDLKTLFRRALDEIEDANFHTQIFQIALLLALSVGGGVAGAIVGSAVRGAILAEAAVDTATFTRTAMAARLAGAAAGLGTDAAINASAQAAIFGDDVKLSFVENLMSGAMVMGAMKPLRKAAEAWGKVDEKVVGMWGKIGQYGKVGLVKTGMLSAELIGGAASGYVAARILHGEKPASDEVAAQWAVQGAMMAVSHVMHLAANKLAERMKILGGEAAMHLAKRADAHAKFAAKLGASSSAEDALHVIDEHARLLEEEGELLDDPVIVARLDKNQLATLRQGHAFATHELQTHGVELAKLHFAGLAPMSADGSLWSGSKAQIETAIADAGSMAKNPVRDDATHRWTVELGGHTVRFLEMEETPGPTSAATMTKPLGERIAGKVPGARYETGGTFKLKVGDRDLSVTVRRTNGKPRVVHEDDEVIVEIPHGLDQAELEKALVEKLIEAHDAAVHSRAAPTARPPTHDSARAPNEQSRGSVADQVTEEMGIGAVEVTAMAVPGSSFKGKGEVAPLEPEKLIAEGKVALDEAAAQEEGVTGQIEQAHVADSMRDDEKVIAANTRVIHLADGGAISIRVAAAPLEGQTVARSVLNLTKQGVTSVNHGPDAHVDVEVHGRYVIQLSNKLDAVHVRRAVAHEVAEILARRRLGTSAVPRNVLRPGADPKGPLSPDDHGRIAEIRELLRLMRSGDPATVEEARHELAALVEDMGLRKGVVGADERAALIKSKLGSDSGELEKARAGETELSEAERKRLGWLREDATKDREAQAALDKASKPLHERPTTGLGRKASKAEREALAAKASAKREAAVKAWIEKIRTANSSGQHPKMRLQIGGNAALAARDPNALLVDANERWAVDASENIAQTAQQMEPIKAAGIGDPYEFANADERVPLEAVRYWQDEIAAQGPVIDGRAELAVGEGGKLIAVIRPNDGSPAVTVEVEGIPLVATGFVKESAPGAPRSAGSTRQSLNEVDAALRTIESDTKLGPAAKAARSKLAGLHGLDDDDARKALEAVPEELRKDLLERFPPDVRPKLSTALLALDAQREWVTKRGKHPGHMFSGDEANKLTDPEIMAMKRVVIAGPGGTGISAAEIILNKNKTAHVTMVGVDPPTGLVENGQFRSVVAKHGTNELCVKLHVKPDGVDGRFEFLDGYYLGGPTEVGDQLDVNASPARAGVRRIPPEAFQGDTYISALGRPDDLPPPVAELADSAERVGGSVAVSALVYEGALYAGYEVTIRFPDGREMKIDVTGAASRYVDRTKLSAGDKDIVKGADDHDAPPESENFPGGYASSARQASRYRTRRGVRGY
jgi:hypothetical protein